jgi:hypothetical protein
VDSCLVPVLCCEVAPVCNHSHTCRTHRHACVTTDSHMLTEIVTRIQSVTDRLLEMKIHRDRHSLSLSLSLFLSLSQTHTHTHTELCVSTAFHHCNKQLRRSVYKEKRLILAHSGTALGAPSWHALRLGLLVQNCKKITF